MAIKTKNFPRSPKSALINIFSVTLFLAFILSFSFILISHLVAIVTTYSVADSIEIDKHVDATRVIDLGVPFEIKKDEVVFLMDTNFKLKVTGFINSPCPKDARCMWGGTSVLYEVTLGDVVYKGSSARAGLEIPYTIIIKDSDYISYAEIVISKK